MKPPPLPAHAYALATLRPRNELPGCNQIDVEYWTDDSAEWRPSECPSWHPQAYLALFLDVDWRDHDVRPVSLWLSHGWRVDLLRKEAGDVLDSHLVHLLYKSALKAIFPEQKAV